MSIELALVDAATNCARENAVAVVTLRSGVQLEGHLERRSGADLGTHHMKVGERGWATFLTEEVAAVEARPR